MRNVLVLGMAAVVAVVGMASVMAAGSDSKEKVEEGKVLRHMVMLAFKESATPDEVKDIEVAFRALPGKIDAIHDFEWGTDLSGEQRTQGFTHCFLLSFKSKEDLAIYAEHPDHKAFAQILRPQVGKLLVFDYWAGK